MLKHILFTCLLSFSVTPLLKAQNCGNDEIYHLPYKNTYVKRTFGYRERVSCGQTRGYRTEEF